MLIENFELTLSHCDLGNLNEFSLMTIFGNAQSHCITEGRGISIRGIVDQQERVLYPGYFLTYLRVPVSRMLNTFEAWQHVMVGVDHRRFGAGGILDSTYIIGNNDEISDYTDEWELDEYPSMTAGTMFTIDGRKEVPQPSVPRSDKIAELPKLKAPPDSIRRFNEVNALATLKGEENWPLVMERPISYPVRMGIDVATGRNLMFSSFVKVQELAETRFLSELLWPGFTPELLEQRQILERETIYFANCGAGDTIHVALRARIESPSQELEQAMPDGLSCGGLLHCSAELYNAATHVLLTVSKWKKVFAIPTDNRRVLGDMQRLLRVHCG